MSAPGSTPSAMRDASGPPGGEPVEVLARVFGFSSFRPLQEEIVADTLSGRDVLVLMPTGGGKSLCYQLPALIRPGLTVVVSPLIALMKDQVDALRRQGIAAALLNSTLDSAGARRVVEDLRADQYRILYVAPERLMKFGFLEEVESWSPALFAIDEAHCISDWGHDFRPDYRQLRELRFRFPDVPMMALTATATERVREDIVQQLGLRDAGIYVASFNRPNLHYVVEPKKQSFDRLTAFASRHRGESGIVYCGTRARTESLAERLRSAGFKAGAYHAGMETAERASIQERFLEDDIDVMCATIAFGMGVDKPDIRFVVHYDLPKNIESYYQETGRAGRDGEPAECLLLYGRFDLINHERRIDEKQSAHEREIARQQLEAMLGFAESTSCRRKQLLAYFGEASPHEMCDACDNCVRPEGRPVETFGGASNVASGLLEDRTRDARRFVACLDEITRTSFPVGAGWVADVLVGNANSKIEQRGHERLGSFGRGRSVSKKEWGEIGRELLRIGLLERTEHSALRITSRGREFGLGRTEEAVMVTPTRSAPPESYDEELFQRLRALRKQIADERQAPAFTVFSDAALRGMAREYPQTPEEFLGISGVGKAKLRDLGDTFMREIGEHAATSGKREFDDPAEGPVTVRMVGRSERETLEMFRKGWSINRICVERGLKEGTVYGHLARTVDGGETIDIRRLLSQSEQNLVTAAFQKHGWWNLTVVYEELGEKVPYHVLRIARGAMRRGAPAPA